MTDTLLIIGASARAAAMSARRSGFGVWAADRFGDLDLRACGPTCRVEDYPAGLERAIAAAPPGPWLYTGALENHPALVERIAADRTLYGVGGEALRRVRDPFRMAAVLKAEGIAVPRCAASSDGLPRDGSWLTKPLASAGGCGVRPWNGEKAGDFAMRRRGLRYFQERIEGTPASAVFIGTGAGGTLLGVTRQLIGCGWCGLWDRPRDRLRYCGSIGPLHLAADLRRQFERLGQALAREFCLRGLFGVDAILTANGVWPVEVNPRYTASVETLEQATGLRAIGLHVAACRGLPAVIPSPPTTSDSPRCSGKAILFARDELTITNSFVQWAEHRNRGRAWPEVADIPAAGTRIGAGEPIATVFAEAGDEAAVLNGLQAAAAEMASRSIRP